MVDFKLGDKINSEEIILHDTSVGQRKNQIFSLSHAGVIRTALIIDIAYTSHKS